MDIKKLQIAVIDALEDVKAQDINLYDTTHLTSLFDRVAIASGTSNRQTKALAASVRDKVKAKGGNVLSVEGEDTGEWVLVDLGDMIVHIMQPAIRAYYRLEEIWGDKEVSLASLKAASAKVAETPTMTRRTAAKPAKPAAVAKPAAKPSTKPAAKSVIKSTTKSAAKPVVKSTTKPAAAKPKPTRTPRASTSTRSQAPVGKTVKVAAPKSARSKAKV